MWASGSILLIAGGLAFSGGLVFSALTIRSEYRRGQFGILAGTARFGIWAVVLGSLLCLVGCALGGWRDVVQIIGG